MKTSELIGPALDWAVAKCEGYVIEWDDVFEDYWLEHGDVRYTRLGNYSPSTHWPQGGPIIERREIALCICGTRWEASCTIDVEGGDTDTILEYGPTLLIAAMRCYVASKLGDEIEIPERLK